METEKELSTLWREVKRLRYLAVIQIFGLDHLLSSLGVFIAKGSDLLRS